MWNLSFFIVMLKKSYISKYNAYLSINDGFEGTQLGIYLVVSLFLWFPLTLPISKKKNWVYI